MSTIAPEQVNRLVTNQHPNPFEVLGPHPIEHNGCRASVVRAYLPQAEAVWILCPDLEGPIPMAATVCPQFFEGQVPASHLGSYRLRLRRGTAEWLLDDPYRFRTKQFTNFDRYLFAQGNHHRVYEKLGSHPQVVDGVEGVHFALWAPYAQNVAITGDFNGWDSRSHQMDSGPNGIWELFIPGLGVGDAYQYAIRDQNFKTLTKSDPYGFQQQVRPGTTSIVADLTTYAWGDQDWLEKRGLTELLEEPIAIYQVHLGSWLHGAASQPALGLGSEQASMVSVAKQKPGARFLTYRELAAHLIPYVKSLGYTHIEVLPLSEHQEDSSWGYQVVGYYACTSRYGPPQDFMYFVDQCHQQGLGVIMAWVPGYFGPEPQGLIQFDGTYLYEHRDPRQGLHRAWGTVVFNYGRPEVCNFLIANAFFWLEQYHLDGLRFSNVAAMLYLDYGRAQGEWVPNVEGGRENLEAIAFLQQVNQAIFNDYHGILSIAEESTDWPMVSWPTYAGGLGFNLKWNQNWTRDIVDYFTMDPWFRQFHQDNITFGMWYHHSENFVLDLSHQETRNGQASILSQMAGDPWQQFANFRCLLAYLYLHPGKKTLLMGTEFAQRRGWEEATDLEWSLLQQECHQQIKRFVTDLNGLYRSLSELHTQDFVRAGFEWIDCSDSRHSVVAFIRRGKVSQDFVVIVCNFTPQPHSHYRVGVPEFGFYTELFNSDARSYGGSNLGNLGGKWSDEWSFHTHPYSLDLCLPPLAVLVLKLDHSRTPVLRQPDRW